MDYIMEAEMLNYETQINMLKEAAYNSYVDESLFTEEFSIKKAWDAFVKWIKEKVGPVIKAMFNWCKKTINFEKKKDKEAKEDVDFILKYQNQMRNAYAGNFIGKKKIIYYSIDTLSNRNLADLFNKDTVMPLSIYSQKLKKLTFMLKSITGITDEELKKKKEEYMKDQEELDKLKIDNIENCFRKSELDDSFLIKDSSFISISIENISLDKRYIENCEDNINDINDVYYSTQKIVSEYDRNLGEFQDNQIRNAITWGNMLIKECIDLGAINKTCMELYKKDKDYQYMFLKQVKALMKEALDRGESVEVPSFA